MGNETEEKRKKDDTDGDDENRNKKVKRARTRSRSPDTGRERDSRRKRRHSRGESAERPVKQERQRDHPRNTPEVKQEPPVRKNKETDMLNTRTGGAYIPPARLRLMQAQITDKSSIPYQRLAWEALKKSIHGHINKINVGNIGIIIKELLKENIVRGRGLLCRSVIQAQAASPTFTNVYAALVAAVNSRFPNIGELLLKRLVIQFKRGFKRNDKPICISSASFIAHLVNQRVAHEILALELLTLLVETPTDDSVEVSISFLKECGQKLTEVSSKGVNAIFEMLRNILHEGQLDKRVQYMIEVMFQVWKDGFKDHPALIEELELVPEEEQFTHLLMLDDATDAQDILNVFKFDEKYEENEQKYITLSKEILGSDAESDGEEGSGESGSEESDEEDEQEQKPMTIIDKTETNLIALRRTVYLTINSSLDFEECAHKLMKMQLKPGQEVELCHMFLDCCAEQRTYEKFYGLLAQRFCNLNRIYIGPFEEIFKDSYGTAHRLDTNRLRNVSKFFAHLLFTDSISWEVLECVKLNEEDTTSSSRIYIKILFQELAEYMGLKKLNDRLQDPILQDSFRGVFPRDNPKNTRFSINFFTSIGLGGLTDELREHLKQMPKAAPPAPLTDLVVESSDSSDSSSSSSDSSDSDSDSDEEGASKTDQSKSKKKKKTINTPEDEPPKEKNERWGHDGFYDTYGKGARRTESEDHHFARPRDVRDDRRRDQRKEDSRDERSKERDNFRSDRPDDSRKESRKDEARSDRFEKRRDDNNGYDERSGRKERRKNEEDLRTRDTSEINERRERRKDYDKNDRQINEKHEDKRSRETDNKAEKRRDDRDREDRRSDRDDGVEDEKRRDERRKNESENNRHKEKRRGDEDKDAGRKDRRKNDAENEKQRDNRNDATNERRKEKRKDEDKNDGQTERRKKDYENDKERDSRSDAMNDRRRGDDENYGRKERRRDYDRERNEKQEDERLRDRDDKAEKRKDDDRRKYEEHTSKKRDYVEDERRRDKYDSRSKKEDDRRSRKDDESINDKERTRREGQISKKKRKEDSSDSDSSSSDESKHEKENRSDKHKTKRDRREKRRSDSDSEEYSETKKEKKSKRREKGDGWDIRGSSIRREVSSRYWEN